LRPRVNPGKFARRQAQIDKKNTKQCLYRKIAAMS
jgi:hypothetical protein